MIQAQIVQGALVHAGLPVLLRNRTASALPGATMGASVDVQVPRALEDRAVAVLASAGGAEGGDEGQAEEPTS